MKRFLIKIFSLSFCCTALLSSCVKDKPDEQHTSDSKESTTDTTTVMKIQDLHSYARPEQAKVTHLAWEAEVDFDSKTLKGIARLKIEKKQGAKQLVLDTKSLEIEKVTLNTEEKETTYSLSPEEKYLGRALTIDITDDTDLVNVHYHTTDGAEALQWLSPEQTAGKKQPFLFTQSQAILARSWVPIQDSPGIRFSYTAKVTVPKGLLALMSAENPTEISPDGTYTFKMEQPIPAYLFALAVGDIGFQPLGPRTGVYAEPSVLEKAAYEFGELESMVKAAEGLYGPYQWERYDLIVLPPSFPFGGMENPRLTFATPTILAGDRSLTSLVAHELAHSWSGNLVTNATWDDFWLNEGFTVYFEQRIMEALYGRDYAEMLASLSVDDLKNEVRTMTEEGKGRDTHLKLDLKGRNPDDGMNSIAYVKGYLFLRMLEEKVGRDKFDAFLKNYFKENAFQVMTTEGFVEYLDKNLFEKNGIKTNPDDYKAWIYGEGLPENRPTPKSDKFTKVEESLNGWLQSGKIPEEESTQWSSHEWQHFIRSLPENLTIQQMGSLDKAFGFSKTGNSEVFAAWMIPVIQHQYETAYPALEQFLIHTGRRKFLMPLYTEMIKTDEGKKMALTIYQKARPNYHFVSTSSLDELLGYEKNDDATL